MPKTPNPDLYRPIDVPDRLKPYVRRALFADTHEVVDMHVDVRATGYHYFGWVWRGRWQGVVDDKTLFDSDSDGPLVLTGQVHKSEVFAKMQRDLGQIFLEFTALGHFQLFGITGEQLHKNPIAPRALAPALQPQLDTINTGPAVGPNARMDILADVLSALPKHSVPYEIVTAIERMEAVDGDIELSHLTRDLGIAERQFRTHFKRLIGLTPKTFCKTLQINRAFNQVLMSNGGDLVDIAARCGFSDQAHFTRAFGEFLGKAPISYLKNVEATLGRFVGQSRQ